MKSRRLIAENLKRIRLEMRLSQEALAFQAGVDRTYVSGLERRIYNPSIDLLDRLSEALGVNTAALFEVAVPNPRPAPLPRGRRAKKIRVHRK
ncbi:MAG: helix-turn-helix transcriptional regulator [Alphaproteobacteria bacterium]